MNVADFERLVIETARGNDYGELKSVLEELEELLEDLKALSKIAQSIEQKDDE